MIEVLLSNRIEIKGMDEKDKQKIKSFLTLPNPLYERLRRMRNLRAMYGVSRDFKYYEEKKQGPFIIGRGVEEALTSYLEQSGKDFRKQDQTYFPQVEEFRSTIKLRRYQVGVPEAILVSHRHGIIKLGTGFGKTLIALKLAELLQTRTLILVPRKHIQEHFLEECRKYFGFEASTDLEGGESDAPISVVTVQAARSRLVRYAEGGGRIPRGLRASFGLVIADEADRTIPTKTREVIEYFAPRHLYGMTATPRRTDGQGRALEFLYGQILVDRELPREQPTVEVYENPNYIGFGDYAQIIKKQTESAGRNTGIASIIRQEVREGRKVLVLTKRIAHHKALSRGLKDHDIRAASVESKDFGKQPKKSVNNELGIIHLDYLRSHACLLGTFSLLSTGLDFPEFDTLVLAGDLKSEVLATQSFGRILRLFAGKKEPKIIDIADRTQPILWRQAKERLKIYQANKWQVSYEAWPKS